MSANSVPMSSAGTVIKMADKNDSLAGPSDSKKRRYEETRPLLGKELLDITENLSGYDDSDLDSESDYVPHNEVGDILDGGNFGNESVAPVPLLPHIPLITQNIIWQDTSTSMMRFPFMKNERLVQNVSGKDSIDYFRHILTNNVLDKIVTQTNRTVDPHEQYSIESNSGLLENRFIV